MGDHQYKDTDTDCVFNNNALDITKISKVLNMIRINSKYNGTATLGAAFYSVFTSVDNKRHIKPEPYVPINMRGA